VSGWWVVAFVVQWVLLVVVSVSVVALARQVGTLHLRLAPLGALEMDEEGPPIGEVIAPTPATGPAQEPIVLGGPATAGRLTVFVSPACPICKRVLPGVPAAARAAGLEPQVVSDAAAEQRLGLPGTPFVLVLDRLGIVRAKGTVNSMEQLEGLVDTADRRIAEDRARLEAM
jgi:hypothetical protein